MLLFPNCKINLGLNIVGKREDGYHNLESAFLPVALQDALEIIPSRNSSPPVTFTCTGLAVEGEPTTNLCIKAYNLLKQHFPQLPSITMHLHKAIPMGAGLGGGSADGAFTLLLLNKKFRLGIAEEQLIQFALGLGSDCPFFIINKPGFATGRGEQLQPISLPLSGSSILLVNPGIHIPTGWAFSRITPSQPAKSIKTIIAQPLSTWKDELVNDFEAPVLAAHPQLQSIKQQLYHTGALYASMSGSGSTFYGIFSQPITIPPGTFPSTYFVKQVQLP